MTTQPKISIVIPSFNRADLLKYGLLSLTRQVIPYDFETLVLSDGLPNDGTKEVCEQYKDKLNLRYIYTGKRNAPGAMVWRIPGYVLNIGVKQAKGEIILITQPEIYHFRNDSVLKLLKPFFSNGANDKLISCPLIMKDDRKEGFRVDLEQNNGNRTKSEQEYTTLTDLKPEYLFFMSFTKKKFIEIGGFDEDFIGNCWDDEDFVHRLHLDGNLFIKSDIKVLHLYHPRHDYKSEEVMKMWRYNKKLYGERYDKVKRNEDKEWGKL